MIIPNFTSLKHKDKDTRKLIKVFGVGGAGTNFIESIIQTRIKDPNSKNTDDIIEYYICNTDQQHIRTTIENLEENYQFNQCKSILLTLPNREGLGAGGDPSNGEKAALESLADFEKILDEETKMVFIAAGMGGGTGTGAAPVIAKLCRERNILCMGFVTTPIKLQGLRKTELARTGIQNMHQYVDALVIIENDKACELFPNEPRRKAEERINGVLAVSIQAVLQIVSTTFKRNVDMSDITYALKDKGTALIGIGKAKGENKAIKAIEMALESPLLNNNSIEGATNAILAVLIPPSEDIENIESYIIMNRIQEEANTGLRTEVKDAEGYSEDLEEDELMVVLIATGFPQHQQHKISNIEPQKIVRPLESSEKSEPQNEIKSIEFQNIPKKVEVPTKQENIAPNEIKSIDFQNIPKKVEAPTQLEITPSEEVKTEAPSKKTFFTLDMPSSQNQFYKSDFTQKTSTEPEQEILKVIEKKPAESVPVSVENKIVEEVSQPVQIVSEEKTTSNITSTQISNIWVSSEEVTAEPPATESVQTQIAATKEKVRIHFAGTSSEEENRISISAQNIKEELRQTAQERSQTFSEDYNNKMEAAFGELKNTPHEELKKRLEQKNVRNEKNFSTSKPHDPQDLFQQPNYIHENNVD